MNLHSWILAARPKTLTASLAPVLVATALAYRDKVLSAPLLSLYAFLAAFCIQIGTNLVNDAEDFTRGTDNAERIGPQRVTASGLLSARQVWIGAIFFFILAFAFGLPLIFAGGKTILILGLFSILFGFLYTAGPYPLAYIGLGDLFVIVFFGLLAVGGLYFCQSQSWNLSCWVAGLQVGFLSTVLIAINNLRDWVGDKKNNKKTLAVRFGPSFAKAEITLMLFLPYLLGFYWKDQSQWAFYLPFLSLPLALILDSKIKKTPVSPIFNRFLGQAALVHILFSVLLAVGLVISG